MQSQPIYQHEPYDHVAERDRLCEEFLERIISQIESSKESNKLWDHFKAKADNMRAGKGPKTDALYLLHSNVYYIRDILAQLNDDEGLVILDQMEHDYF
jgi:hypothetical protein